MDDAKFNDLRARLTSSIELQRFRNNPPPVVHQPPPADDGMWFSRREQQLEQAAGEHWARRRKADAEVASQQRLHDSQRRDLLGAWADDEPDGAA